MERGAGGTIPALRVCRGRRTLLPVSSAGWKLCFPSGLPLTPTVHLHAASADRWPRLCDNEDSWPAGPLYVLLVVETAGLPIGAPGRPLLVLWTRSDAEKVGL